MIYVREYVEYVTTQFLTVYVKFQNHEDGTFVIANMFFIWIIFFLFLFLRIWLNTCHVSPVTCHLSLVNCHLSPRIEQYLEGTML